MFTCCPQCQTCFRVTAAQLKVAQGKVRCGKCQSVFNARLALYDKEPEKPAPTPAATTVVKSGSADSQSSSTSHFDFSSDQLEPESPGSKVERNDHEHFSLDANDSSSESIDAIFDALDEQLTSGVFKDIRGEQKKPEPVNDVDIESYFDQQMSAIKDPSPETNIDEEEIAEPEQEIENITAAVPAEEIITQEAIEEKQIEVEDTFLSNLRKKTDAESQQLELNIGDTHLPRTAEKQKQTKPALIDKDKEQLKQVIDSIIQTKTDETSQPVADEQPGKDEFTIIEQDISDTATELSAALDEEDDKAKDTTEASAEFSEESFEFDASNVMPDEFSSDNLKQDEPELEINNEFELIPTQHEPHLKDDTEQESIFSFEPVETKNEPQLDLTDETETDDHITDLDEEIHLESPANNDEYEDEWDKVLATPDVKDEITEHDVPIRLRESVNSLAEPGVSLTKRLLTMGGIVFFTLLLGVQVLIFKSTELVQQWPGLRDTMVTICDTLPCRYTGKRDLKKITMLSRDIRVHPKNKAALLITAAMANQTRFDQPYPDILLRFTDLTGEVVAQRRFNPQEYLGKIYRPFILMPASTPVHLTFAVLDPGSDAINFEFDFL